MTSSNTMLTYSSNPRSVPTSSVSPFIATQMRLPVHLSMSSGERGAQAAAASVAEETRAREPWAGNTALPSRYRVVPGTSVHQPPFQYGIKRCGGANGHRGKGARPVPAVSHSVDGDGSRASKERAQARMCDGIHAIYNIPNGKIRVTADSSAMVSRRPRGATCRLPRARLHVAVHPEDAMRGG